MLSTNLFPSALTLSLVLGVSANVVASSTKGFGNSPQQGSPDSQQPVNSAELTESEKLSLQVVKLYQQGNFEDAIPLAKQALKIREKALGTNHPRVADAASNLALLYVATKKFDDAESLFKRALAIYEKNQKEELLIAKTLESIAFLQGGKPEFGKAEALYLRAISIKERMLGPDNAETLSTLRALADFHMTHKNYVKAEAVLEKLITAREKQLGRSPQEVGSLLESLACAMYKNNEKSEAEKVEARANHILYGDTAKKPEPIQLSQDIFECKLIKNPTITMPAAASGGGFSGTTRLVIVVEVDEGGNVTGANMVSGAPLFKKAAEQAALSAKLRPTVVDGRPVRVKGIITHQFSIETRMVLVPGTVRP